MNKRLKLGFVFLPWLIALGIAALSAVTYTQLAPSPTPSPSPTPVSITVPNLSAALSAPYPLDCLSAPDSQLKGDRVYVDPASRSFRIDSTESSLKQHLIFRDTTFWSWFEGAPDGDTLNISAIQPNPLEVTNNLVCQPWTIDSSYFTLPSQINFTVTQARIDKAWEAKRKLDELIKETNARLIQEQQ